MKKIILATLVMAFVCPGINLDARRGRGGSAVAGALGGLAIGTMIGSAASRDRGSSRAEQAAIRAEDKAERVQDEQERQRISRLERDLERKELERKLETLQQESRRGPNNMVFFLYILASILLLSVIGIAIVFFKRKP